MIETKKGLDSLLKDNGIKTEDIKHAKSIYPEYNEELKYYYEKIEEHNEITKVDIEDIYAPVPTRNVNEQYSWYDNLFLTLTGQSLKYNINLEKNRFENLLEKLITSDTDEFLSLLENRYTHTFSKYIGEDNGVKYYQEVNNAHKLILAKVIGAKYLTSNNITTYKYNAHKARIFHKFKQEQENLINTIKQSKLFDLLNDDGYFMISYNPNIANENFEIKGGFNELLNIPLADNFQKKPNSYISLINKLKQFDLSIKYIEKSLDSELKFYRNLPKFLLKIILKPKYVIDINDFLENPNNLVNTIKYLQIIKKQQ